MLRARFERVDVGVILFQEQVLEIAHRFAGMSLQEADDFRALMSKFHDPKKMESMRERFVSGAVDRGVPRDIARAMETYQPISELL